MLVAMNMIHATVLAAAGAAFFQAAFSLAAYPRSTTTAARSALASQNQKPDENVTVERGAVYERYGNKYLLK